MGLMIKIKPFIYQIVAPTGLDEFQKNIDERKVSI